MTFSRLLIFLFITIGISVTGFADNIRITGTILEASGFHKPVVAATIKVLNAADSSFVTAASAEEYMYEHYVAGEDNQKTFTGGFSVEVPRGGKYIFTVSCVGYKTTTLDVDASKLGKKEYRLQLDPIYLAEVSEILNEVVVKASKVKFYNKGDVKLFGNYRISQGIYKFSLQEVIRKDFIIKDGSTITFNGNPANANLDIQANYTVNSASLNDLISDASDFVNQTNVKVNCVMNLSGHLTSPTIKLDLELPNERDEIEALVRNYIPTDEQMNMQILYLLSIGKFYPSETFGTGQNSALAELSIPTTDISSGTFFPAFFRISTSLYATSSL